MPLRFSSRAGLLLNRFGISRVSHGIDLCDAKSKAELLPLPSFAAVNQVPSDRLGMTSISRGQGLRMCGGQALPPQLGDLRRLARDKHAGTAFEAAVLVEGPGTRDPVRPCDRSATIARRRDRNDHNAVDGPTPATGDPSPVRRHSPLPARNEPQVPHATAVRAAAVPATLADKLLIGRLYRGGVW